MRADRLARGDRIFLPVQGGYHLRQIRALSTATPSAGMPCYHSFLSGMHCPAYAHNAVCKYACMHHVAKHAYMPAYVFLQRIMYTHAGKSHSLSLTRIYSLLTKPPSRSFAPSRSVPSLPPSLPPSLLLPLPIPLPITAALRSNIRGSGGLCVALEPTEHILSQNQTRK